MLVKILVLLAICLTLTTWPAAEAYRTRKRLHDPNYDNDVATAQRYYGWLRVVISMCSFVAMLTIMLVTELTIGGMSTTWENISIVVCVVLALIAMFATLLMEGSVVARLSDQQEEASTVRSSAYRHTN